MERCAACGKTFTTSSKPRWAFTPAGRPAGRVHAAPCIPSRNRRFLTTGYAQTVERAQFDVWLIHLYVRPEQNTPEWEAFLLTEEPSETLSKKQEELLDWWANRPNDPKPTATIDAIRVAHTALIRQYRAWQAALDAAPNGCS